MKRIVALLLCLITVLSLVACGETAPATEPETKAEETKAETPKKTEEEKKTEEAEQKKLVIEDTSMLEKLEAIPIANASMSSDELRKICVDFMRLQCSFCYTPSENFKYTVESQEIEEVEKPGTLYAGLPYVTAGSGSLYRLKPYYDSQTGVINMAPFVSDARCFGNACSGGTCTSWSRVINSVQFGYTMHMTQKNGYINVGPYTYPNDFTLFGENERNNYDCPDVCKENGEQTMYESYALTLPGDGIVNTGHVRMVASNPVVVRKADGTIDGEQSYFHYLDQICYNTSDTYKKAQSDGTVYFTQGGIDVKVTFAKLFETNYIPFTFGEFIGTNPVEPAEVTISGIAGKDTITHAELASAVVTSNYNISDVIFTVKDASGKVLIPSRYLRSRTFYIYQVNLAERINDIFADTMLYNFAKDGGILTVDVQLYNGQCLNVYTGNILAPQKG